MVIVVGRGGIGKTALVCRLLRGWEADRVSDADRELATMTVGGIVYLSRHGVRTVGYPTLVEGRLQLVPAEQAPRLRGMYDDSQHRPTEMMWALLEAFPVGDPVVVLLDNLESVMDAEREDLVEPALHEALETLLTAPAHTVTVIATTRIRPTRLLAVEPARQRQLRMAEGLGSPDAETVLRKTRRRRPPRVARRSGHIARRVAAADPRLPASVGGGQSDPGRGRHA